MSGNVREWGGTPAASPQVGPREVYSTSSEKTGMMMVRIRALTTDLGPPPAALFEGVCVELELEDANSCLLQCKLN